jgi:hypothetical protein
MQPKRSRVTVMPRDGTSLTVIVPTKNSRQYLPAHIEAMRQWLDLAAEVTVVDSESTDGTVDYLRAELKHPEVRYLTHPPGLYGSWNFAIANVETEYVYISTTGDTITRRGLETLLTTITTLDCDVVLSKPTFRFEDREADDITWPVDEVIRFLQLRSPKKLTRLEAVTFAACHPQSALLGSVASDLFRTSALKRFPFPTDFGTAGDGAWGLMHAAEVSWAVVPEKFSSFLLHPTGATDDEKKSLQTSKAPQEVLAEAMQSWRRAGLITDADYAALDWDELMTCVRSFLDAKRAFDNLRHAPVPWWLRPDAWKMRMDRESARKGMRKVMCVGMRPRILE